MKDCPDCGTSSPDAAVTCAECGSLFVDQIGIEARRRPESIDRIELPGISAGTSPQQPSTAVSVCRTCGATGVASQQRCVVCGSDDLVLQLAKATASGRRSKRLLTAWERRPRIPVLEAGVPDLTVSFANTYFAIGVFKLLFGSLLGSSILFSNLGPQGLQYITYVWRYPLAAALMLDAFISALGGYGVFNARRYGAYLLASSFILDILLIGWLVFNMLTGRLVMWPDSGPYIFLAFICLYCFVETSVKAVRGNLK